MKDEMLVEEMLGGIRYSTYKVEHFDSARSVFGDWKLSLSTTLYLSSLTKLCRERWPKCMIAGGAPSSATADINHSIVTPSSAVAVRRF